MNQTVTQPAAGQQKPEMWFLDLAKSKIIMAASKSCELIIFFGTLWLTLITVVPAASTWLNGALNTIFIAVLSFAVDAAMPESFLHVVSQYVEGKKTQLKWSVPLAIGMFALVVANVLYSKLDPKGGIEWLVNILLITRMIIGILYISIRECQNFIDRHNPTVPRATIEQMLADQATQFQATIANLTTQFQATLADQARRFQTELQAMRTDVQALSQTPDRDIQATIQAELQVVRLELQADIQANLPALQAPSQATEPDLQAFVQAAADYLVPQFQARLQAVDRTLTRQGTTITELANQVKQLPERTTARPEQPNQSQTASAATSYAPIPLQNEQASRDALMKRAAELQAAGLSTYKIAEALGKPSKTVQSWLSKSGKVQADSGEREAINEQ